MRGEGETNFDFRFTIIPSIGNGDNNKSLNGVKEG